MSLLISMSSYALSCRGLTEKIIANCTSTQCKDMIYLKEIRTSNECHRRPILMPPPNWSKQVIEYELKNLEIKEVQLVELTIKRRWWRSEHFSDVLEYSKLREDPAKSRYLRVEIKHIESDINKQLVKWKEKENLAYSKMVKRKIISWSSLLASFIVVVFAAYLLVKGIIQSKISVLIGSMLFNSTLLFMGLIKVDHYNFVFLLIFAIPGLLLINLVAIIRHVSIKIKSY